MQFNFSKVLFHAILPAVFSLAVSATPVIADEDGCEGSGDYSYICGLGSPEDLVLVPETKWVIASGFAGGVSLYLVDGESKAFTDLYPADAPRARQDMSLYGACPGSPDPNRFDAHGLNIQPGLDGISTLYTVGHGEREAIEVFEVDASGEVPVLTWTGCVLTPDGMAANSVASMPDGSLLVTIPLETGITINRALAGENTGGVYRWSPGDTGFAKVEGTEMPYANGIEVSIDGSEFYVASSGAYRIFAFSNTNPAVLLRTGEALSFIPDNLHRDRDGRLLTAGLSLKDPVCGDVPLTLEFDLAVFASCPRPFTVLSVDPATLEGEVVAESPAQQHFSNVTMALRVGDELWLGTFVGDRIAYLDTAAAAE